MAGALSFLLENDTWQGIGYYLQHWNSDAFSLGCLAVLVILLSGYFYGCVFRRFIEPLERIDCTLIGVMFILAVFQILVFFMVSNDISTSVAYFALAGILLISPLLCLVTWSRVIPSWQNLVSLLVGLLMTGLLVYGSMGLNTNNIYFDSITYLSEVVESAQNELFAHMAYPGGYILSRIDPLHDFTGYYYFWGIVLRWIQNLFSYKAVLTPIYIWGATVLYGMCLGSLTVSCASVLFGKRWWLGILFLIGLMAPYYTNYFNTTLAFFGNTMRTAVIGACVMTAFLILKEKTNALLFVPLTVLYYAALHVSSSSMFLIAFITAGLFFGLAFSMEKNWKRWTGFIVSAFPLFRYAFLVFFGSSFSYPVILGATAAIIGVLVLIAFLLRKHLAVVDKVFLVLFPILFAALCVYSFLMKDSVYNYAYFFRSSSLDDMTVNMTSHLSTTELIRNIIFYALLALTLVNFRYEKRFKVFLYAIILLFLNPLVQPAVSNLLTQGVYSRSFDILNNPFTLCFLAASFEHLIPIKPLAWTVLALVAGFSLKIGWDTLTTPYSKALTVGSDDWNWEAKVSNDSYEVYQYVNETLSSKAFDIRERTYDNRPIILSQDSGLKGYVPGIEMAFSTEDYRSALDGNTSNPLSQDMITLMYPDRRYTEDDFGEAGDYSKLGKLFLASDADYVVLNNTLAVWDERGWFYKPYQSLIDNGMCQKLFENESWVVLKINREWETKPKSSERYWVHMYDE